jgi:hypothetical protein
MSDGIRKWLIIYYECLTNHKIIKSLQRGITKSENGRLMVEKMVESLQRMTKSQK